MSERISLNRLSSYIPSSVRSALFVLGLGTSATACMGDDDPGARTTAEEMEADPTGTTGVDSDTTTFSGTTEMTGGESSSGTTGADSTSTGEVSTTSTSTGGETGSESTTTGGMESVCGDGVVEGVEECEPSLEDSNCSLDCRLGNIVFATSTQACTYGGVIGSVEDADALCNKQAADLGLVGYFKAWISDDDSSPLDTFIHSTLPYIDRYSKYVVAENWDDLTTCDENDVCLQHPITPVDGPKNVLVLTGTSTNGSRYPGENVNCLNWSTYGNYKDTILKYIGGRSLETNGDWTAWDSTGMFKWDCSPYDNICAILYCFEQ